MLQKAFAVLLALLMLFALVPTAFAEDEITIVDTAEEAEEAETIVLAGANTAVTITVQPEDAEVPEGGTAVFHVEAAAGSGETIGYRWQYYNPGMGYWQNSGTDSGEKTDTYRIRAAGYRNGYRYRCLILVDGLVCETSREALLTVYVDPDRPAITAPADSTTVSADLNDTVTFAVSATGRDLRYQWQFSPRGSNEWSKCSGESAGTAELRVEAKKYRNYYRYRCKVYNDIASVYSPEFVLTINGLPNPPSVRTETDSVSVSLGLTTSVKVKASGRDLHYQWYWRTGEGTSWNLCTGENNQQDYYAVKALRYRNGYQYRCKVWNDGGTVYSKPITLIVIIPELPQITRQPQSHTQIKGKNAYFIVEAEGDSLFFQWQYRTGSSGSWSNCSGSSATSSVKLITAYAYRDGYQYRARVYNGAGAVYSAPVTLSVVDAGPIVITRQPESVTLDKWGVVSLRVEADCAEDYRWYCRAPGGDWELAATGYPVFISVPCNHYEYVCLLVQGETQLYSDVVTVSWPDG